MFIARNGFIMVEAVCPQHSTIKPYLGFRRGSTHFDAVVSQVIIRFT